MALLPVNMARNLSPARAEERGKAFFQKEDVVFLAIGAGLWYSETIRRRTQTDVAGDRGMIRGAVFDFDYTLYDRDESDRNAMGRLYGQEPGLFAPGVSREKAQAAFVDVEHRHNYDGWERMCRELAAEGIFSRMPDWRRVCDRMQELISRYGAVYDFIPPMFDRLREMGLRVGLITNGNRRNQEMKVRGLGLWDRFDHVLVGSDPATAKPHADLFLEMAGLLGCRPGELIYAGDHPVNDVDAARRAGYIPVWVKTLGDWRYPEIAPPEYAVDTVAEIPGLIESINLKGEGA